MSVKTRKEKIQTDSSTSMRSIKTSTKKMTELQVMPEESETKSLKAMEPESPSPHLRSRQVQALYDKPDFRLAWQNQVKFRIAQHIARLRRAQGMSQAELAKAMKTSQPLIARLESGEENFTADTLQRAVDALNGRFDVSISPAQMNLQPRTPWWSLPQSIRWTMEGFYLKQINATDYGVILAARGTTQENIPQAGSAIQQ